MSDKTVLVCGGRDYKDRAKVFGLLDALHAYVPIAKLVHGGSTGADALAHEWAKQQKPPMWISIFLAQWDADGRAAGPIRNEKMLSETGPDLVVAFPGGRGTADMVSRARDAGVTVLEIAE